MYDLNSVLIEGEVSAIYTSDDTAPNLIRIRNNRVRYPEGVDPNLSLIPVELSLLPLPIRQGLAKGRTLRVVGRLDAFPTGSLFIMAEHIELKPGQAMPKAS